MLGFVHVWFFGVHGGGGFLDFLSFFLHVFAMSFFLVAAVSSDLSHIKLLGLCAVPADLRGFSPGTLLFTIS